MKYAVASNAAVSHNTHADIQMNCSLVTAIERLNNDESA